MASSTFSSKGGGGGGSGGGPSLPPSLDLVKIMRAYVDRALSSAPSGTGGAGGGASSAAPSSSSKQQSGMKTLVLDAATTRSVASAAGQSDLLAAEVYLTEAIENWKRGGEKMAHLKAVYFVRPTRDNIARVRAELRDPRFGSYSLNFCNRLDDSRLQDLADADARGGRRVSGVAEAFGDFEPVDPHHFVVSPAPPLPVSTLAASASSGPAASAQQHELSLPLSREPHHLLLSSSSSSSSSYSQSLPGGGAGGGGAPDYASGADALSRTVDGLSTVLLSLRRRFKVRAVRGSEAVAKVAGALHRLTDYDERALFDFGSSSGSESQQPLLLILDRRDDPVTPLLTQWSYQAMAHELLGLSGGRLSLAGAPGVSAADADVVLSTRTDPFFARHSRSSFGDLGGAVKSLVDAAARAAAASRGAPAAADLQGFVESYGDLAAAQAAAARHVSVVGELSRLVERRALMEVSEVEQELACGSGVGVSGVGSVVAGGVAAAAAAAAGGGGATGATTSGATGLVASHFDAVARLLPDPRPSPQDKLRLLCLFALRHERDGRAQVDELMRRAGAVAGLSPRALAAVPALLRAAGANTNAGGVSMASLSSSLGVGPAAAAGGRGATLSAARPRVGDLFGDRSTLSRLASFARASLRGVDNVYTRHTPLLVQTVEAALKGKLSRHDYPFVGGGGGGVGGGDANGGFNASPGGGGGAGDGQHQQQQQHLPRLVVVFVVGGTTFEEAAAVAEINAAAARGEGPAGATGARVLLGGTGVLNSSSFLRTIEALAACEQHQQQQYHYRGL